VEELTRQIAALPGVKDLALTTNGFQFLQKADMLREAGLRRVSFSLDSLDRGNFKKMTGRDGLQQVLSGIAKAKELGLKPVKVNVVVIRGINDHEIEALADFAREQELSLRFIEFMPLDSQHLWQRELVVKGVEILERLKRCFDLIPRQSVNASETAQRWQFSGKQAEIGLISPVSEPFCGHCNRIRITADGRLRTCLFSVVEHDLKPLLRGQAGDEEIAEWLVEKMWLKEERHHIGEMDFVSPPRTMSCIGG
jgi:GTP 3',8-cyclase